MRKILKNRRGMALESAILFLIVIFAFCMLITSMSVVGKYQLKIEKTELENRVRLDQIGEAFVAGELKAGTIKLNGVEYRITKKTEDSENEFIIESGDAKLTATVETTPITETKTKMTLRVWYGDENGNADLTVVLEKTVGLDKTYVVVNQWYYTQANQEATGEKTNGKNQ